MMRPARTEHTEHTMLETARLVLREVNADDVDLLVALRVDPEARRFLGGPTSLDEAKSMAELSIAFPTGKFVAERLDNHEAIGLVLLHPGHGGTEISYQFLPSSWGQGFAGEAVRCVLDYAADSEGISEVIAVTQTANERSCRLLDRLGLSAAERFEEFGEQQTLYRTAPRVP
jgi:[ribosomal protein S5]-alanine N-acetyltransferase